MKFANKSNVKMLNEVEIEEYCSEVFKIIRLLIFSYPIRDECFWAWDYIQTKYAFK